jgi:hypothetical protein
MTTPGAPPRNPAWLRMAIVDITPLRRHRDFRRGQNPKRHQPLPAFRNYDARRDHAAPDPDRDSVERDKE